MPDDWKKRLLLTAMEEQVWLAAYGANQPQPNSARNTATYWAAAAVLHLRGEKQVLRTAPEEMFEYMKAKNTRQRESL